MGLPHSRQARWPPAGAGPGAVNCARNGAVWAAHMAPNTPRVRSSKDVLGDEREAESPVGDKRRDARAKPEQQPRIRKRNRR